MLTNKYLGVIGGGQLGMMICQSASRLNIKTICLDPNPNAPAFRVCDSKIIGNYNDKEALKKLNEQSDVILYEFENISSESLAVIDSNKLFQGDKILKISQSRKLEKEMAQELGIKTGEYRIVSNEEELVQSIEELKLPVIVKTISGGYDGKGQALIKKHEDLKEGFKLLKGECIVEKFIDYDYELSVIGIRSKTECVTYSPFINEHRNQILHLTKHQPKKDKVSLESQTIVENIMKELDIYGILTIEFFVKNKQLYFNEIAPRPHNSGHITMDDTTFSQFDNLVRAAYNYKLSTKQFSEGYMINVLGQNYETVMKKLINLEDIKIYLYGKDNAATNRKIGHINTQNWQMAQEISKLFKENDE